MRTFLVLLFALVIGVKARAQDPWLQRPDSLKKVLESTVDDEIRLQIVRTLFIRYVWSHPDSAIPYANQFMLLAKQKESNDLLASATANYVFLATLTGNFPQALEYGFKALSIAERTKNFLTIAGANHSISSVYLAQGDIDRSVSYARKAIEILETGYSVPLEPPTIASDTSDEYASVSYTLCKAYVKAGQPDSVLKYVKQVEWIWGHQWREPKKPRWPTIPWTYGNVSYLRGDYPAANRYYREGVIAAKYWDTRIDLMEDLNSLAKSHGKMHQWDSAIYYAKEVLKVSETARNPIVKMEALTLLANAFKIKNNVDSSAKYFELTLATKDSLFNQSRIVQMQNSTFNEQLRQQEIEEANTQRTYRYRLYLFAGGLAVLILISVLLYRSLQVKQKAKEKVEKAFGELKAAQSQLIQSEKMASLGELTAGIAHEIQNPLNFVNNFSEVNKELLSEMKDEIEKGNFENAKLLAGDVIENQEKINQHGKRADAIVKGMLQHSRSSNGVKEPTDINALCEEYLRLSYHGFRAKDKNFNAIPINIGIETDLDSSLQKMDVVPQDIGRAILNLINNAFYAVSEKKKRITAGDVDGASFDPTVSIRTKKLKNSILISVKDNGNGIPGSIKEKIFQPFFTTKPAGQGTGLGLSLSYDIVKAHRGELRMETMEGEGTEFIIELFV
jgi:two-component system NtrC family sensor kinase